MGKPLREVYPHASTWQLIKYKTMRAVRWFVIRFMIALAAVALLGIGYLYSMYQNHHEIVATQTIALPITANQVAPILERISDCESGNGCKKGTGHQYQANGLPVFHANTDGSVDIGKYQINSRAWGNKAHELGYDLLTEKGNEAMATWILENVGTGPWSSSAKGWN